VARPGRLTPRRIIDAPTAATAEVHNLTLVTRNQRDVEGLGVRVLDPFVSPR
jgi:predicted nucleic acid-binding protein